MALNNIKIGRFIFMNIMMWLVYSMLFSIDSHSFGMVFSSIYIGVYCVQSLERKYYMILFALPFAAIFKIAPNLPSTLVILYVIFLVQQVKTKKGIYKWEIISIVALIILQLINILRYNAGIKGVVAQLINIMLMFSVMKFFIGIKDKNIVLKNTTLIYTISLSLSILVADMFPQIPYIVLREKHTLLMNINRFSGLNGDPNYYSQLVLVAIGLMTIYINRVNMIKNKVFGLALIVFMSISGFRSISKSYALAFIAVIMLIIIIFTTSDMIREKNRYITIWKFSLGIGVGCLLIYFLSKLVIIPLIESRTDAGDFFTGRTEIWGNYIESMYLNVDILFLGVGLGNSANTYNEFYNATIAPHNVYIEIIYELGLIGIGLCIFLCREIYFKIFKLIFKYDGVYMVSLAITSIGIALSSNDAIFILAPLIILGGKVNEKENKSFS